MPNNKPYAIYLRKSRADRDAERHGVGETLARHEEMLSALAHKMNLTIADIYREIVSGETISSRPEMMKLLENVEQGKYEGVLVVEVERLARGATIDQGIVAQAFQLSGTKIITPTKTYDPNNEFDEEYFEFGLFMARREYKTINRRIQRGRVAASREGRYVGSTAPYGYERYKIPDDKGYSLRIIPEQAEIIKRIFDLYVNGKIDENGVQEPIGTYEIARELDEMGVHPVSGKHWSPASLRDILKNPVYIGKIRWGNDKEVKTSENGVITKKRIRNKDCIIVDGLHEAIIDEHAFYRAQERMKDNMKSGVATGRTLKNPLSGLVYCQKCGRLMTRLAPNSRNKYSTLKCPNRYCDNISVPIYRIEHKLLDALKEWVDSYEFSIKTGQKELPSTMDTVLTSQREELKELNSQLQKTYDFLERELYDEETFLQRNAIIKSKIADTQIAIKKMEDAKKKENILFQMQQDFLPSIRELLEGYYSIESPAKRNELLKSAVSRANYLKEEPNTRGKLENDNFQLTVFPKLPNV